MSYLILENFLELLRNLFCRFENFAHLCVVKSSSYVQKSAMRSMMNAMPDEESRNSYGDGVALLIGLTGRSILVAHTSET